MAEVLYIRGVKVPEKYVDYLSTKKITRTTILKSNLSAKDVLAEPNIQVRAELVTRLGPERIISEMKPDVIDKEGDYELWKVNIKKFFPDAKGLDKWLKMRNPSIGTWHIESVGSTCNTIQEAKDYRATRLKHRKGNWNPMYLS